MCRGPHRVWWKRQGVTFSSASLPFSYSIGGKLTASGNGNTTPTSNESRAIRSTDTSDPIVLEWINKGLCVGRQFRDATQGTNKALTKWRRFLS